ncbi:hypothetical protein FRC11_010366 [Ceratobasidium sp. 423]|nr:hypothetical protein FRC11_010366 [Ceratobasidium sp. 423]
MPAARSQKTFHRETHAPYPGIVHSSHPVSHPPAFDVDELFDWSRSSTGAELTSKCSLPPPYSSPPSVLPDSASPSEIERFFTPLDNCSSPTVTSGSSIVKLRLSTPHAAQPIQLSTENKQFVTSVVDVSNASPKRTTPVNETCPPPSSDLERRRRSSNNSKSPSKYKHSHKVVNVEEYESEESDDYEEAQPDGENDSGDKDVSSAESASEYEYSEHESDGNASGACEDKKRLKSPQHKELGMERVVRSQTKTKPEGTHTTKLSKLERNKSRNQTPVKPSASNTIQARSESHDRDSDSTTGKDDTPEQPWE